MKQSESSLQSIAPVANSAAATAVIAGSSSMNVQNSDPNPNSHVNDSLMNDDDNGEGDGEGDDENDVRDNVVRPKSKPAQWKCQKKSKTPYLLDYFDFKTPDANHKLKAKCKLCTTTVCGTSGNNSNFMSHLKYVSVVF